MGKITTAVFEPGSTTANVYGLWQYDYGQTLRIQGLHLPSAVAIHFSLQETGGTSVMRVGVTKDGVTDVIIPDSMLENDGADRTYDIFAFIYLTDDTSGQTEYKIKLQVKSRPKPEVFDGGENPNIFHEAVQAVQKSADKAAESEKQAEGWAHGREDLPERAQDNARYYAGQAAADAKKTGTDRKEVERLVESVSGIDEQVMKVENLTKQAQTSATNAALSEQAAKTAETNAQNAQAGAETAEGNAELAERNAKASEQAVEKAKQLVTQMGQEVLDNKNHVDQTAQAFDLTAQQAVADVNNAGQTQTERVQTAGESAVESVKTAQGKATQAVETAKTEAVKAVQTEGTTQTGNVSAEGAKQVQAVQQAAQEIVSDREQIAQNKAGVEALKQGKADAIVDSASGENITLVDSDEELFRGLRIFGKSTQDGVPSPENPKEITCIGDDGDINLAVYGKNLLDTRNRSAIHNGVTFKADQDGVFSVAGATGNEEARIGIDMTGTRYPADKYTFLAHGLTENVVCRFAIKDTQDSAYRYVYAGQTVELDFSKYNSIILQLIAYPNKTVNANVYVMLYKDGDRTFEPYREPQSITISTPNGLPGIPVDSGGNYTDKNGQQWISDKITEKNGEIGIERKLKKYIFTGNEVINKSVGSLNQDDRFSVIIPVSIKEGTSDAVICNRFINDKKWGTADNSFYANKKTVYLRRVGITEIRQLQDFLKTNETYIIFRQEEAIFEPLSKETQDKIRLLHTNYPTTVVSNDESAHMEVSYVADTKRYIASKIETPLQKQITDLQNALISQKISGGGIKVTDSARLPIKGLRIFGKSTQDGVPSLENPVPIVNVGDKGNINTEICGKNIMDTRTCYGTYSYGKPTIAVFSEVVFPYRPNVEAMGVAYTVSCKKDIEYTMSITNPNPNYAIGIGEYKNMQDATDREKVIGYIEPRQTTKISYKAISNGILVCLLTAKWTDGSSNLHECTESELVQVEIGNTATSYETPKKHTFFALATPNGLPGIKVDSGGNYTDKDGQQWISDEIDLGRGKYVQRIEHYTSNGHENIGVVTFNRFSCTLRSVGLENCIDTYDKVNSMCENLKSVPLSDSKNQEKNIAVNDANFYVRLNETTTMEDVISLLTEGIKFSYILKTPIERDLTHEEIAAYKALHTNYPTTTVLNDENADMELTYTVDTQSYVDTKIAEVSKAII